MSGLDVSVVITATRGSRLLAQCLAHLEVQSHPAGRFEVVVCCPDDPTLLDRLNRFLRGTPIPARLQPVAGTWAEALTVGTKAAAGRWVLYLNEELLPGPDLIEAHVRTQENHGGRCVAVGPIALHPHVPETTITHWDTIPSVFPAPGPQAEIPWYQWHADNLSIPREAVTDAGGFDMADALDAVTDLELGYRLSGEGFRGHPAERATAYALRPTTVAVERSRHYRRGYATHGLLYRVAMPQLREYILGPMPSTPLSRARFELAVWERLAASLGPESTRFRPLMRRILRMRAHQGYEDAHAGRARRALPTPGPLSTPALEGDMLMLSPEDDPHAPQ